MDLYISWRYIILIRNVKYSTNIETFYREEDFFRRFCDISYLLVHHKSAEFPKLIATYLSEVDKYVYLSPMNFNEVLSKDDIYPGYLTTTFKIVEFV